MVMSLQGMRAAAKTKHARYCATSANAVVVTQLLLLVFIQGMGWGEVRANVAAVSISCVPSFLLNRFWVWPTTDRRGLWRQAAVFWGLALVGLALSTLVVALLSRAWDSPVAANVGNIAAFGVLWVGKFIVLDRVLFSEPAPAFSSSL